MSKIRLSDGIVKDDVLVIGIASNPKGGVTIEPGDLSINTKALLALLSDMGATGKVDEIVKIPSSFVRIIVFTGLGAKASSYSHETLRRAAGAASRALDGTKSATFALPTPNAESLAAVAEGAALGAYAFTEFRGTSKGDQKAPLSNITIHSALAAKKDSKDVAERAEVIAQYTHLVRDLINTPPSHLTPDSFTKKVSAAVKSALVEGLVTCDKSKRSSAGSAPVSANHAFKRSVV